MQRQVFTPSFPSGFIMSVLLALYATGASAAHHELRLDGDVQQSEYGFATASGDFNNDGYADLAVGVPSYGLYSGSGTTDGRVYVYYGAPSGFQATPDWVADSGQPGQGYYFGVAVANAGDVTGDGIDDLMVGESDNAGGGKVYFFAGSSTGLTASGSTATPAADAVPGLTLTMGQPGDKFGDAIASGDVNKDGNRDVIVGAYNYNDGLAGQGAVFVYLGNGSGWNSPQKLTVSKANAQFGKSVAVAGDMDGDGWLDLIVGAKTYNVTGANDEGAAFVYYGNGTSPDFYASTPDWSLEGDAANGELGVSVASAGDVNNDGKDDVIIGAWAYEGTGAAFVFHGASPRLSGPATPAGADWQVKGANPTDALGTSVAGAGDINGDGIADVIVGADSYDNPANGPVLGGEGQASIYYGSSGTGLSTSAAWSKSPLGEAALDAHYGGWVQGAGDIDGDGQDDYVVSAYAYSSGLANGTSGSPLNEGAVFAYLSGPAPAVVADPSGGLTTTEAGGTASFTVALSVQPSADVTVHLATDAATEGTVSTGTAQNNLTFTGGPGGNWSVPQTVTITGQDDFVDDGDVAYNITFTVTSADTNFDSLSVSPVTVTNRDDDTAGVTVTPASVVTEYNVPASFTIVLASQPTFNVTIPISSSDTAQGTVSPASVTFTPANWNVTQTVTVTGTNPNPANNAYTIVIGAATSGDPQYNGLDPTDVQAVNRYSTVSITATDASAAEPGTDTGTFTVSRDGNTSLPLPVNYTVSGASTATSGVDYTALSGSVAIAAGQSTATITVTPLDDSIAESDETVTVGIASGTGYLAASATATVTIIDDDIPPTASFSADQIVAEGSTVTVSVTLSHAAVTYPVTIPYTVSGTAVNPDDHDAADGVITINSGTTGSLTFTTVSDNISEGDETVIFTMGTPTNATAGTPSSTVVTITEGNGSGSSGGGGGGAMGVVLWLAMLIGHCQGKSRRLFRFRSIALLLAAGLGLGGCGGGSSGNSVPLPGLPGTSGPAVYAIRGIVSGLTGTLVLQNNGGDDLTLTSNGGFTFATNIADGKGYNVSVFSNPDGQDCTVSNGTGTVNGNNVTGVSVTCKTRPSVSTYTVGGTLSGLSGGTVVLQNNGGDDLTLTSNGSFTFDTAVGEGGSYNVTVATQPSNQSCSVTDGSGTVSDAAITGISVTCVPDGPSIGLRSADKIALGRAHTCAILDGGVVKCWGNNRYGQLGLGDTMDRGRGLNDMGDNLPPVDLGTGRTAVQIAAGSDHTCAILDDGSVKCWGFNKYYSTDNGIGQLGLPYDAANLSHGDEPGEMGDNLPVVDLGTGHKALRVTAGWRHSCAILDDGSVKCWGNNQFGQLGGGSVDLGTGRTAEVISAGDEHTCALLDDDTVKCWGNNDYGQLGQGDRVSRSSVGDALPAVDLGAGRTARQIAAGSSYTCALLDNFTVKCWGGNYFGQLGLGDTASRGDDPGEMGDNLPAVDLGSSRSATQIAVGHEHACAILDDATVKCWGYNVFGELGLGDTERRGDGANEMGDSLTAADLGSSRTALQIAVGNSDARLDKDVGTHSCAILDDNTLKCWGSNAFGQLGFIDAFNDTAIGNNPGEMGDNLPPVNLGN